MSHESRRRRKAAHAAAAALAIVTAGHAGAARAAEDEPAASGDGTGLRAVVVTATRTPAAALSVPASVSVVTEAELERRPVVRFGDALADVPGLYVRGAAMGANYPGSGQAVLSMRGIPRTPRVLVMIDGQPVNNALSGGVNVAAIPFDSVERVEVVRGPYSALYGGNAMSGVINFITAGPDQPLAELRAGAGSLGTRGASLALRNRFEGGLGITFSTNWRESDGYDLAEYVVKRPSAAAAGGVPVTGAIATTTPDGLPAWWVGTKGARPWSQDSSQLAFHYSPSASTKLVAGFGLSEYRVGYSRFDSFLRRADGSSVYSGLVSFDDGGTTRRLSLAESDFLTFTPSKERDIRAFVRADHRLESGGTLQVKLGTLRHNLDFSQPVSGVSTYEAGRGEFVDQPNQRTDLDVALRKPVSERWILAAGFAANHSTMDRQTLALAYWRDASTATTRINAGIGTSNNAALFAQAEGDLGNGLTAYVGGRYDRFETWGQVIQDVAPAFSQSYDKRSFDQFSPKLAMVWQARSWLSTRVSYGAGFRPPALLDLYSRTAVPGTVAGTVSINEASPDLKPERVKALEIGADALFSGGRSASVALYRQQLQDLIYRRRLTPTLTRTENAGEADVDGVEASFRWPTALRGLTAFGAITHQFRYEITQNDAVPDSVGKVLTDVPQTTWSLGVDYDRDAWAGFLAYRWVGHVYGSGDDLNRNYAQGVYGSYDQYGVLAGKLLYRVNRKVSVSLALDNITDREYFVFNRQPGRTAYAELILRH